MGIQMLVLTCLVVRRSNAKREAMPHPADALATHTLHAIAK